jgi:hypothetical protein
VFVFPEVHGGLQDMAEYCGSQADMHAFEVRHTRERNAGGWPDGDMLVLGELLSEEFFEVVVYGIVEYGVLVTGVECELIKLIRTWLNVDPDMRELIEQMGGQIMSKQQEVPWRQELECLSFVDEGLDIDIPMHGVSKPH